MSFAIASGWSPDGGKIWLRRKGLLGKATLMLQCSAQTLRLTGHFISMNAPHSPSPLASLPMAPSDPILGVTEAYVADKNPRKVNLGVGVYTDDSGKIPLLEWVRKAEELRTENSPHRGYLPIDGLAAYDAAVKELLFGSATQNIVTVQAVGGTGGLRVGADFLKRLSPEAEVWIRTQ